MGGVLHKMICRKAEEFKIELESLNVNKLYDKGKFLYKYLCGIAEGVVKDPTNTVNGYLEQPESFTNVKYRCDGRIVDTGCDFILRLKTLADNIKELFNVRYSAEKTLESFNNLRLLGEISNNIDRINAEHNRFLLSRTKWLFSQMVDKSDSPFVFEKMGTQLKHIMIDEFQDTARTQWENIRKLLLENVSKGETCLIVGDVKQSIYRFNGGDWSILANMEEEIGVPINDIPLSMNFRSQRHIVEFNNAFFLKAAAIMETLRGGNLFTRIYNKENTEQHFFHKEKVGYVRCTLLTGKKSDSLDESIKFMEASLYGQIKRLCDMGVAYNKMTILVRWNKEAEKIADIFSTLHPEIPLVSQEAFMLSASPVVMTVVSALRWIYDKTDSVSLAYCADVFQNRVLGNEVPMEHIAENPRSFVPEELILFRDTLVSTPLYECALQITRIFSFHRLRELSELKSQSVFLASFFDEILNFLNDGNTGISIFLRHWDEVLAERRIPSAETGGISIVTVHKSKGLAFDTVLIPFCDWEMESPRTISDSYLWAKGHDLPYSDMPPYPVRESKSLAQSTYSEDYCNEHFHRRVENLNLLYVAFTRAQSNLIIWGKVDPKHDPEKNISCGYLLHRVLNGENAPAEIVFSDHDDEKGYIVREYGDTPIVNNGSVRDSSVKMKTNPFVYESASLPIHITPSTARLSFLQSSESRRFIASPDTEDTLHDQYIQKGKLYHRILSEIHTANDISRALQRVRHEGLFDNHEEPEIKAFIEKIIDNPHVRQWFDGSWTVINECSIVSRQPDGSTEEKRPDRVMTKDQITIVVDYKFGKPHASYRQQVGRYLELLRQMGHANSVAYLWYVYDGIVEEVK